MARGPSYSFAARHRSGADPWLRDQLFKLAVDRYGTAKACTDWSGRVRRALRVHAAPRLVNLSALAEQCGMSRRGLSRRLAKEGVTVSELIDEVLFERARPLLRRPGATATQVAEALGYAELSSFLRAFRRWSGGLTPSAYRRHHGATGNRARLGRRSSRASQVGSGWLNSWTVTSEAARTREPRAPRSPPTGERRSCTR
jgi:AraC-like DNA-binding protein